VPWYVARDQLGPVSPWAAPVCSGTASEAARRGPAPRSSRAGSAGTTQSSLVSSTRIYPRGWTRCAGVPVFVACGDSRSSYRPRHSRPSARSPRRRRVRASGWSELPPTSSATARSRDGCRSRARICCLG
jgi:hypothetical protein